MINFLHSKIDFKARRSPYETSNPDVNKNAHPKRAL